MAARADQILGTRRWRRAEFDVFELSPMRHLQQIATELNVMTLCNPHAIKPSQTF
jgi:hypothetical protein